MADIGELLDLIQDEVALTVTQGLPVSSVWTIVTEHLEKDRTAIVPLQVLDPSLPNPPTAFHPALPFDTTLRVSIWDLIQKDKDISIGINNDGGNLSFDDAEAGLGAETQPHEADEPPQWRLFASESLLWRRIAGHEKDTVRLFPTLWELLKIIALNKEDGILQPMLTSQSGQDARSVGPRTKDLAGKGYIMKIPVIALKMRTSKLVLKRFWKGSLEKRKTQKKKRLATLKEHAKTGKKMPNDMVEEALDIEEVISGIFRLLKSAKNKVMVIEDIKFRLNCTSTKSRRKACRRIMNKLESMGCIQKIRAVGSENLHAKRFEMGPVEEDDFVDLKNARFAKCLKYVRDLKPLEWGEAVRGVRATVAQEDSDAFEDIDSDEEQDDDGYRVIRKAPLVKVINERRITVPLWKRTHIMHIVYDQILAAGSDGVRGGVLSDSIFGPFYYRPFDQIMGRWTTNSQQSQPDHLKHVSIVRETDLYKRTASYRYWTTENFQAMLSEKQLDYETTDALVDAFKISKKSKKSQQKFEKIPIVEPSGLDENGFTAIRATDFVNADGSGSFQDCQNAAPKKGSGLRPPGTSPLKGRRKVKREIGEDGVSPTKKRRKGSAAEGSGNQSQEESVVVIGRKRKYPPGTEPYLKEKPRVEAVKRALKVGSIRECAPDGQLLSTIEVSGDFQPLSSIPEDTWTIEMVSERTFMDLVENTPYQVPVATARYRNTHGKRGRPRNPENAPKPEVVQLEQMSQFGKEISKEGPETPDGMTAQDAPSTQRPKRRKTQHKPTEPNIDEAETSDPTQEADGEVTKQPAQKPKASRKPSEKSTARKKNAILTKGDEDVETLATSSKRKSGDKDSVLKTPAPKKPKIIKTSQKDRTIPKTMEAAKDVEVMAPQPIDSTPVVILTEDMEISKEPLDAQVPKIGEIEDSARQITVNKSPRRSQIQKPSTDYMSQKPPGKNVAKTKKMVAIPKDSNSNVPDLEMLDVAPEPATTNFSSSSANTVIPTTSVSIVTPAANASLPTLSGLISNPIPTDTSNHQSDRNMQSTEQETTLQALEVPEAPEAPKLEPYTDSNGVKLELVRAEVRKNRSIGGVLKANRRRLLMEMLSLNNGAVSINAGYHKFATYVKEQREQLTTVDRRTYTSIIDDANKDGKIWVIGVFKGKRRIGTILSLQHLNFQSPAVEDAKCIIFDELDKPFIGRQIMAKTVATKPAIPIERIDFERYSYTGKPIVISNKSSARRGLDAEKLSTLARLQAITENEKREGKASSRKAKGRRKLPNNKDMGITTRTRSKRAAALHAPRLDDEGDGGDDYLTSAAELQSVSKGKGKGKAPRRSEDVTQRHRRAASQESVDVGVPEETLHRWQVPHADPSLYDEDSTNFPPYTVPETGNLGYGLYNDFESYAAASALNNESSAGFGMLMPNDYQKPQRKRQQAGGRARISKGRKVMMINERETNPVLADSRPQTETVGEVEVPKAQKKRGRKPKEQGQLKESNPPKQKKPPKPRVSRATRPKSVPRIRTTPEEDETLTLAIIIIRTLFGGYVRSIKWDLVAGALPQHDRWSIQSHWPRVRQKMKEEIPQYQAEFEEQYLRAFYKEKLPFFDKNRGRDFDLMQHVNWLRPLVKRIRPIAERRILPSQRTHVEASYDITIMPVDWRKDFFSYMTTMSWKEHQLRNHSNAIVKEEPADELAPDKRRAIERVKSVWRSIMITEDDRYDDDKAKELLKIHPQNATSAALTELHKVDRFVIRRKKGGRFGTAAIQARILQPWRTAVATSIFEEAKDFHAQVTNSFAQGNDYKLASTTLAPGMMAWVIDRLVGGEIELYTKDYMSTSSGLRSSLVTRAINPALFHFDIFISSPANCIAPPTLNPTDFYADVPQGSMKDTTYPPFIWQNLHDEVIKSVWERVIKGVLAIVIAKPGTNVEAVVWTLQGVLCVRDVTNALRWLLYRGGVVEVDGRYWAGKDYLWSGVSED